MANPTKTPGWILKIAVERAVKDLIGRYDDWFRCIEIGNRDRRWCKNDIDLGLSQTPLYLSSELLQHEGLAYWRVVASVQHRYRFERCE